MTSPNPTWHTLHVTATRPDTDSGTVAFSRQDTAGKIEQRNIQIRYGGRSILTILFSLATVVLLFLHKDDYAALTAILAAVNVSMIMDRYRRDLRWITGYGPDRKNKR